MVRINQNKEFVVYDLDTQQSAINRLAAEWKTLPRYLYFPDGIPTITQFQNKDGNIRMENLLEIITSDEGYDFVPIFEKMKDKLGQQKLNIRDDIFIPYVAFNKTIEANDKVTQGFLILFMQTEIDNANIFTDKQDIYKIWDERDNIISEITNAIEKNKKSADKQKKMFIKLENISGLPYTSFELERVNFEFTLAMNNDVTIMELFNHIQLNANIPFACINNIYKILKDFIPVVEWGFSIEKSIILKVSQKKDITGMKIQDFTNAVISILGEPGRELITVGMILNTSGQYLSRNKLIKRFLSVIKGLEDIKVENIRESLVNGVFYFPKHRIDKYVLSDLVMNNPDFSSIMSIDESDKASKLKESIYVHFQHPKIGTVTANITEKISEKGDQALRGKDIKGDFKFGTNYIRVKISSADNVKSVQEFQELFAKLMFIYDEEYQNIVDIYRTYIPDFAVDKHLPTRTVEILKLKDIAPEVFVKGYPPKCPHQPTIIGDDEIAEAEAQGKIVMRYPKDNNEGFIQRNYICDHPGAKFPGLRDNPLSNQDLIPFLPCCYTKNHNDKEGSIYRHYYYGEKLRVKVDTDYQDLIITNKFVPRNRFGTLPNDITKLFDVVYHQEEYMYVRKGVFDTKSSFLECVMEGMYEETDILDLDDKEEREARLYEIRNDIATAAYAASCRQEMYDFTTDEIMTAIQDPEVYMDPKLFTSMLEDLFDCNIYVFNRTNMRNGQLAIPRHLQAFYKTKRRAKCVFIYEHWGSTSDHATYPRCELIVRWRTKGGGEDDVEYYSTYDSKVSIGVRGVFNRMRQAYALNVEIPETEFPIKNKNIELIEQGIDSYGKCRMIRFSYKRQVGTLLTTPIQPLNIPEVQKWVATKLDIKIALQFAVTLGITISGQSISQNFVKELYGIFGNVKVSIPIKDSSPINGVPILDKGISYPEKENSALENYNRYKKLTRYITEYMFWLFSKYLQEDKSRDMGLDTIRNFFQDKVKIVEDFEYGHVSKVFAMNGGVMDGGKLVIKSKETLKRLVYTLRVSLRSFRQKIMEYHTYRVVENYYVDVTDFDQHQFQVILQGDNSVEKWIREQKIKYDLYDSVQLGIIDVPYFFKNKLVGNQIYLAQNTDDLQKALKIAQIWIQKGYNPGENIPKPFSTDQLVQFTLYRYVNSEDITLFRVSGIPTPLDIKMMGYKVGESSFFTVLLPL